MTTLILNPLLDELWIKLMIFIPFVLRWAKCFRLE